MKTNARLALLAALMLASLACNIQRVLDPSLPTSTSAALPQITPTWTPEPSPTPAQTSAARVEAGDLAFFNGDWDTARREYQQALNGSGDDDLSAAALLGIGRSYYEQGEYLAAREALNTQLSLYPASSWRAEAYFALAEVLEAMDNPSGAAEAYANYLQAQPGVIDSYIQEWRGDALRQALDYVGAIAAYQAAAGAARVSDNSSLQVKIGNAYLANGDVSNALLTYQAVAAATSNDFLKADMNLAMGRAYVQLGQPEQAYPLYLEAVNNYPLSYSSYAALVDLVNAGVEVDEFQRGLVDYYAATNSSGGDAQELYGVAIAAFDRYLLANPDVHASAAHHFMALSNRALGDTQTAIDQWDELITAHEFEDYWEEAYSQKALTEWAYQEDYEGAIDTLMGFLAAIPNAERAPEFLFTAGRIAERGGRLTRATELWQRLARDYPASGYAYDALFLAGISYYRLEQVENAHSLFNQALDFAISLEDQSQALFWIGKSQFELGDQAAAETSWQQTAATDLTGYYSERAADLLAGRPPFDPPASYSFAYDVEAERAAAEGWMRSTFGLPAGTDLSSPGALAADERFVRGQELWKLGQYSLARAEFESLRTAVQEDPADSYRLANALIDMGLYRSGIFAARQVLSLAGMSDTETLSSAPTYFNRLRFGAYYADLVVPKANAEGFHPLYVLSAMRQESLFEAFVASSAGAWGLLQIIPSTGAEVAASTGWPPDFEASDLLRPLVSVRLGIDYMEIQANAFDNDLYAVLAAYNAGPGWANYWGNLAEGDMDLFLEVIHFQETSNHIRSIYELFNIYRDLYGSE